MWNKSPSCAHRGSGDFDVERVDRALTRDHGRSRRMVRVDDDRAKAGEIDLSLILDAQSGAGVRIQQQDSQVVVNSRLARDSGG